jgi:hypothetical protein
VLPVPWLLVVIGLACEDELRSPVHPRSVNPRLWWRERFGWSISWEDGEILFVVAFEEEIRQIFFWCDGE